MTNTKSSEPLVVRTETVRKRSAAQGVTFKNDIKYDVLIYLWNDFWGEVSMGYVRMGKSVTLPTIVNVDAYALFQSSEQGSGAGVFLEWPGPTIHRSKQKINLTPGQTYSLSDFN